MDGSGSVTSASFDRVRNFAKRFLDAVDLGFDYTRVAVVQYSSEVQVEFYLNEFYDKEAVIFLIRLNLISGNKYIGSV